MSTAKQRRAAAHARAVRMKNLHAGKKGGKATRKKGKRGPGRPKGTRNVTLTTTLQAIHTKASELKLIAMALHDELKHGRKRKGKKPGPKKGSHRKTGPKKGSHRKTAGRKKARTPAQKAATARMIAALMKKRGKK